MAAKPNRNKVVTEVLEAMPVQSKLDLTQIEAKESEEHGRSLVILSGMSFSLNGSKITHDLSNYKIKAAELYADFQVEPVNEIEIAYRGNQAAEIKKARSRLGEIVETVTGEFIDLAEFREIAKELDGILQKTQALGEKQAKDGRANLIKSMIDKAQADYEMAMEPLRASIEPFFLPVTKPDWASATHKKQLVGAKVGIESQLKLCVELATAVAGDYAKKLKWYRQVSTGYESIFGDLQTIITFEIAEFQGEVSQRIAKQVAELEAKSEALREKIAAEEKAKAEAMAHAALEQKIKNKVDDELLPAKTILAGNPDKLGSGQVSAESTRLSDLGLIAQSEYGTQQFTGYAKRLKVFADELRMIDLKQASKSVAESARHADRTEDMRKEMKASDDLDAAAKALEIEVIQQKIILQPSMEVVAELIAKHFCVDLETAETWLIDCGELVVKKRESESKAPEYN